MIITEEERKTVQKWHANVLNSLASELKDLIDKDKDKKLEEFLCAIVFRANSIRDIARDWRKEHPEEAKQDGQS